MIIEKDKYMFHNGVLLHTVHFNLSKGYEDTEDLDWYPSLDMIPLDYLYNGYIFSVHDKLSDHQEYMYVDGEFHKTEYIEYSEFMFIKRGIKIDSIL